MDKFLLLFLMFRQDNIVSLKSYLITEFPSKSSESVDFVIITTDELTPAYEKLRDWKIEKGLNCVIKTVNWITQNYPGSDTPDRIHNFLKSAYENWDTHWALLGGDPKIVPARHAVSKNNYSPFCAIACDMYYCAINSDWNADGDSLWGEAVVDSIDFTPSIWVGRLPGSTIEEANKVVTKTIEYEKTPFTDCLERALILADSSEAPYTRSIISCFPDYFEIDTLWRASRQTITDSMSKGYGFVYYAGHGSSTQNWSGKGAGGLNRQNVDRLTAPLYSLAAISCYTHWIEVDCLSRHFMLNTNISCLGSSRVGWFSEETRLNQLFYTAIFDSLFPMGKALAWQNLK